MKLSRNSQAQRLLSEIVALRADLAKLSDCLNATPAYGSKPPADATAAAAAREAGRLRGFFTVADFAATIGRHKQYVSDRCLSRVIRTLKGGKPYRIPLEEEARWNGGDR
jgi:hypothetical protein